MTPETPDSAILKEIRERSKAILDILTDAKIPFEVEINPQSDNQPSAETMDAFTALSRLLQNPDFSVWFAFIRQKVDRMQKKFPPDTATEAQLRHGASMRVFAWDAAEATVKFVQSIEVFQAKRQAWLDSRQKNPGVHTTPPAL